MISEDGYLLDKMNKQDLESVYDYCNNMTLGVDM
jgi:hypothetical protein